MHKKMLAGIVISVIWLTSCSNSGRHPMAAMHNRDSQSVSVETQPVGEGTISRIVANYGTIQSSDMVNVTPQVSNRITHIYAHIGDTVKAGQVLAQIYDKVYKAQVAQNKAQLSQARSALYRDSLQFIRQKKLYKKNLASDSDYESARATYLSSKAQYESAKAALDQSKQNLNYTDVRSPVYGVVTQRNVNNGNVVTANEVIYQINNLTGLESHLFLPRQDWQQVKSGQLVTFYLSQGSDAIATGRVTRKSPQLNSTTGLGEVVVSISHTRGGVSPGMLCRTEIDVQTHRHAVIIPRDALVENVQTYITPESNTIQLQHTYNAYIVKNDSIAVRKKLKLGIEEGNQVEVLSGLSPGDKLIVTGQNGLQDSANVRIVQPGSFGSSNSSQGSSVLQSESSDSR